MWTKAAIILSTWLCREGITTTTQDTTSLSTGGDFRKNTKAQRHGGTTSLSTRAGMGWWAGRTTTKQQRCWQKSGRLAGVGFAERKLAMRGYFAPKMAPFAVVQIPSW